MSTWQDDLEAEVEHARQAEMDTYRVMPETDARTLLERWRLDAETHGGYARCIDGEVVLELPYDRALVPGHIYSEAGRREYKITRICEYHFDQWTKEEDE